MRPGSYRKKRIEGLDEGVDMATRTNGILLKDLYRDYFRMGVACERINGKFTNHEIGNPDKEELMQEQFNSMTFGNELKPAYNMGFADASAREDYLPFVINPSAKAMLDWAVDNQMPVRGHVLVWHSQCPKEVFCKGYEPVTIPTDPELLKERPMLKMFEKLDPVCYVDRDTMLARMKSYIFSLMEYMYQNRYAKTIYAWDVVNEAIELDDKTPTGLRNSYWYQVIGDDFIYWAFRYAHDAVWEMSVKYAGVYGVDPSDENALAAIRPKLFYNDYNEFQPAKKEAIINALKREGEGHGSILGEALADGIGMQGHLSDNNDIDEYMNALMDYSALVREVHITELDVKCTCSNKNAEYYQAVFYKRFFEELVKSKKEGSHLTSVTFWGLTDDNSWIRGANPLLFRGDLSPKKAYDALVFALSGESLGEPEEIEIDLSDRFFDFETPEGNTEPVNPEALGFKMKGFGEFELQNKVVHSGKYALANERRFGGWSGISLDISDFIGQTVRISAWVKSPALAVLLKTDPGEEKDEIGSADTTSGGWSLLQARLKVPNDVHSMVVYFTTREDAPDKFSPVYVDDVEVRLIGLEEGFEEKQNIASIRGAGHLPFISVVDSESHNGGGHSLFVTRQEKDATVKFNISSYIGRTVSFTAFVKTKDKQIRLGLDGAVPTKLAQVEALEGEWTEISAVIELPDSLQTAEVYIETDGNADYYVDDIFVQSDTQTKSGTQFGDRGN